MSFFQMRRLMDSEGSKIVTVGILSRSRELLCGLRRDNGLWTNPGGHMDAGETPHEAALREVFEETGLHLKSLKFITGEQIVSHRTGKPFTVFAFMGEPYGSFAINQNDPDHEVSEWRWVPLNPSRPELSAKFRHAKNDLILKHLGIS